MAGLSGRAGRLLARLRTRRSTAAGGLVALLLASLVAAAFGHGYPASRVMLSGGGAWLASASQGLVTLIDGASEQVVGSVAAPGAARGDALSVVQSGASAYVVDGTQGTVSRVDGATYEASAPVRFGAPNEAPQVYAGSGALYIVDGGRRVASVTDPLSLRVRQRLSLAAQPGPGQSVVDGKGRLWVVDAGSGVLTRFDGHGKLSRRDVADQASQLVLVRGEPVLVDVNRGRLGRVAADGTVDSWSCMEVRGKEKARLLGSATSGRVFAAISSTGTLVASSLDRGECNTAIVIGDRGDDFGPLVEMAGFVFVPNRSTGHTTVVDVNAGQVVADVEVVKKDANLELTGKDGFVFYNDLDGDQAGVIRLDGGQWRVGKALKKYNPSGTGEGILTAGGGSANTPQPPTNVPDQRPTEGTPPGATKPDSGNANLPRPPEPPRDTGPTTPPPPPPAGGPPVIGDITWNPDPAVRGKPVTFTAKVANADNATWKWTLTAEDGTVAQTSAQSGEFTVTPQAGHGNTFTIKLELKGKAGAAQPMTKPVPTASELQPKITSITPSNPTPNVGDTVKFTATETVAGSRGKWTWEIVNIGTGVKVYAPTEVPPSTQLIFKFTEAGRYRVRLVVTFDGASDEKTLDITVAALVPLTVNIAGTGGGTVSGTGLTCSGRTCTGQYPAGTQVQLTATPDANSAFQSWSGCTSTSGASCQVTVNQAATVTATFKADPLAKFVGNWTNVDPSSPGIIRVQLDRAGATTMTLHVWASCSPSPCDWGTTTATLTNGQLHAFYDQGFATRDIFITKSGSQLVVNWSTHFTSGSGDYTRTETMNKS